MRTKLTALLAIAFFFTACNNSSNNDKTTKDSGNKSTSSNDQPINTPVTPAPTGSSMNITVEGQENQLRASALVQKDPKKLAPGNDYFVVLTCSGSNKQTFHLNFLMALKPGKYPIVGNAYIRGESPKNEMYGGILGGEEKLTDNMVNVTECKDLGSNNAGGHRWSISGDFGEITIPAMGIMLMDKSKNHPKEIKIEKGSFSNVTFDDNWDEMMNKAKDMLKKN